jgi:hypothetical protein
MARSDTAADRQAALEASGLPECHWLEAWDASCTRPSRGEFSALVKHVRTCGVCHARDRYIAERFPPMPERFLHRIVGAVLMLVARIARR